jgi:hypothetical protein
MYERCARASQVRDLTVRLSALAVVAAVTLTAGPTARVVARSSATERLSSSETPRQVNRPGDEQGAAGKTDRAPLPTVLALFSSDGKSIVAILASFSELHREPLGQFTAHDGILSASASRPMAECLRRPPPRRASPSRSGAWPPRWPQNRIGSPEFRIRFVESI